jgi:lipoprotein-anchoring transpeptidase ErfK/SrfK
MSQPTRRLFMAGAAAASGLSLAGCGTRVSPFAAGEATSSRFADRGPADRTLARGDYESVYGSMDGERYAIPAFEYAKLDPMFLRQEVAYARSEAPGTIVVDPTARFLYRVEAPGRATRYGVGTGREGFSWSGEAAVHIKRDWPDWVPPREMVARDPEIRSQLVSMPRGLGVPGGPKSPLGARAMYLFAGRQDTGYRIHGTTEPETIGTHVSSGCIRMVNHDVIHLYHRTPNGAKVVILAATA